MTKAGAQAIRRLFGEVVCSVAAVTDAATLDLSAGLMDRVHDGADALLNMRHHPDEQMRYVSVLPCDALTLQLPKPDTGDDQIPCRLAVDKDEDVLRCQVDEELAFEARPSRR